MLKVIDEFFQVKKNGLKRMSKIASPFVRVTTYD